MNIDPTPPADPRELAYAAVIAAARNRPFAWGTHDCVTFAAECVVARTGGEHPLDGLAWPDAATAARMLRDIGGLRSAVSSRLGEPVGAAYARTGDVVIAVDPNDAHQRLLVTVCHGGALLAPSGAGLAVLPLGAGLCAWKVGDA